jgi:hypothetical protein
MRLPRRCTGEEPEPCEKKQSKSFTSHIIDRERPGGPGVYIVWNIATRWF